MRAPTTTWLLLSPVLASCAAGALPRAMRAASRLQATPAQDRALPDAAEILDKAHAAGHGKATVQPIPGVIARGRCRFRLEHQEKPGDWGKFVEWVGAEGRFCGKADYPGFGSFEHGGNEELGWEVDPTVGVRLMKGKGAADQHRWVQMRLGLAWRELYEKGKCAGKRDLNGRPHWVLRMIAKTGSKERLWIDAETFDYSRVDGRFPSAMGEQDFRMYMDDYRIVDGVRYPFKIRIEMKFLVLDYEYESIEHAKVPEERLAMPEAIKKKLQEETRPAAPLPETAIAFDEHKERHTVAIRIAIRPESEEAAGKEISKNLAIIFPEVMGFLQDKGLFPDGPPFTRWHSMDARGFDLEAGFTVPQAVAGGGRIKSGKLPGGKVAQTIHIGQYEDLPKTYRRIGEWVESQKYERAGPPWDFYLTNPADVPDPKNWRTRVVWPVRKIIGIETTKAQPVASIRVKTTPDKISTTLAELLPEVMRHLDRSGVQPAGPPFSRYHTRGAGEIDLEAGIPVAKPIAGEARVQAGELPAGKAAMTWHVGDYRLLHQTYAFLERWMKANQHAPSGAPWEFYVQDPAKNPDPAKWQTQIFWPIK